MKLVYLLLKIYDQRRELDILVKDFKIPRNIAFERVKRLRKSYVKRVQLFWL